MSWVCEFSANAEKDLKDLPKAIQQRVARIMSQMAIDPFQVNVIASRATIAKACSGDVSAITASYSNWFTKRTR
jgi:mRNA-degrading endonuclease RelE of RelBE toxin-antitoxin system